MKLKYRIIAKEYDNKVLNNYIAQYKIFGIWLSINHKINGSFFKNKNTICFNIVDAYDRINTHQKIMHIADTINNIPKKRIINV